MVTTVGLSDDFNTVIHDLISLDFDAVEAYQAAIERLDNNEFKQKLKEFREDHLRHTRELSGLARARNVEAPTGPGMKAALTKGKVIIADLFGDEAILMAMKTNEDDTNTAYERAVNHKNISTEGRDILQRGLADERRHRAWIEDTLSGMRRKAA